MAVCFRVSVIAGIGYELVGRPFDMLRREWHVVNVHDSNLKKPPKRIIQLPPLLRLVINITQEQGLRAFFRPPPGSGASMIGKGGWKARLYPVARTFARVGPWGAGFFVWEAFGPGIQ